MMARIAYGALVWLALPFALVRLAWRARRQPGYLQHLAERFGATPILDAGPVIWIHAVSVGETRAAVPLVSRLRTEFPGATFLITHMTPTGREAGRSLLGNEVTQAWLPWDLPFAARRFLRRARPAFGVILETEIWPNLLAACQYLGVPVFLVNARLSERSARRYARAAGLVRATMGRFTGIAAQTADDALRFRQLGAGEVVVSGNIKFDLDVPEDVVSRGITLRKLWGEKRRVWVAGSTREGEEAQLIDAIDAAEPAPDILVVLVPRHPQRFESVAALLKGRGHAFSRRSDESPVPASARYVLGDSMGEMLAYYAAADVVLVGGSLEPLGGQNLIEACAVGRPVIFGPHTFNFESAAESALGGGAGLRAKDAADATRMALMLLDNRASREQMGLRAKRFAQSSRGATDRVTRWIVSRVSPIRAPGSG